MSTILILLVRVYQWTLRPFIGAHCRFEPHCSAYAIEALQTHGAWRGTRLSAWRVLRCNPWNDGGLDPVPCSCVCDPAPGRRVSDPAPGRCLSDPAPGRCVSDPAPGQCVSDPAPGRRGIRPTDEKAMVS